MSVETWHVGSWNEGESVPIPLAVGLDHDDDTDGTDVWSWRVAYHGRIVAQGREDTYESARAAAFTAADAHPHSPHWSEGD